MTFKLSRSMLTEQNQGNRIKDRISKKEVGYLDENQYLEKFQCVVLRKIDNNTYDIAFQNIQEGIRFNKLL